MHTRSSRVEQIERIGIWLETISSTQPSVYTQVHRKRKRPLDEMSNNISTPQSNRAHATTIAFSTDENQTPRPSQHPLTFDDNLPPVHFEYGDQIPASSDSSRASWASSDGRKRKRGGSPAKRMAGLRYARYPTRQERFSRLADLPSEVRVLAATMQRLGRGVRVISSRYKDWLSELGNGEPDDLMMLDQEQELDRIGETPALDVARRIMRHANRNDKLGCPEAAWNGNVHSTLLDEAWYGSVYRDSTRWDSM